MPLRARASLDPPHRSATAAFLAGFRAAWRSVMAYVLIGTYIGIAALAHDFGFSLWWLAASTVLVWAGPAQVILVSALGAGATPVEAAIAVSLSSVRLLPMVISLLPLIKQPQTRNRDLLLPAHLTAVTMWIEALRLLPAIAAREPHPILQWAGPGFHAGGAGRRLPRLLSRHLAAAAVERGAAVPHADVVPDLDDAQLPSAVGLARARLRSRARAAARRLAGRPRPVVDRDRGRLGGLRQSIACARRANERRASCLCAAGAGRLSAQ